MLGNFRTRSYDDSRRKRKVIAGVAAIVGGTIAIGVVGNQARKMMKEGKENKYEIVQANDILDDEYNHKIPIKLENGNEAFIDENEFIVVKGTLKKGANEVICLSSYGELKEGEVNYEYLKKCPFYFSEDVMLQYSSLYRITSEEGANLRGDPKIDSTIISTLDSNELVLASTTYLGRENDFLWVPVLRINEYGIDKGYVREDLLEKVCDIIDGKIDEKNLENNNKTQITEKNTEESTKKITEQSTEKEITKNTKQPIKEKSDETTKQLAENTTQTHTEKSTEETIKQSTKKVTETTTKVTKTTTSSIEEQIKLKIKSDNYLKNINKIVNTSREDDYPLNCRAVPSTSEGDIVCKIPTGSNVKATGNRVNSEQRDWIEIEYKDKEGKLYKGWVAEEFLQDIIVTKVIDTSKDEVNQLNMRKDPSLDSEIIVKIETGRTLDILENNWKNLVDKDGHKWVKIKFNNQIGYVATDYLKDKEKVEISDEKSMKIYNGIMDRLQVKNGKVVGIDVSSATADNIQTMIDKGIAQDKISQAYCGTVSASELKSKVNFVYISIGAMSVNSTTIFDRPRAIETIRKCEELGIPYGFYYYSESINEEEAQKEFEYIKSFVSNLGMEVNYNLLPLAIDVEVNNQPNRQSGIDVTDVKARLSNLLSQNNIKNILYTSNAAASINNEISGYECISIPRLEKLSDIKDVWYVTPKQEWFESDISNTDAEFIKSTPSNVDVVMRQVVMDGNVNGVNVDVDIMNEEYFKECIKEALKIKSKEHEDNFKPDNDAER